MLLTIFKLKKYFVKKKKANFNKINAERYKKEFADFLSLAKSKIEQFSLNNWQVVLIMLKGELRYVITIKN